MDLETAVSIAAGVLAFFLFIISALSYRREKRRRLLLVTAGFLVFAVQEAMNAMQEAFLERSHPALEGYLAILSLIILLLFVAGLIKK